MGLFFAEVSDLNNGATILPCQAAYQYVLCVWYMIFILCLNVVNAGFWPWKRVFLCSSVVNNENPDFYNLTQSSSCLQGTAQTMVPALQLTEDRLQFSMDVSISVLQAYKYFITNIHAFILCTEWDLHPCLVRSICWTLVPRFTLSATVSSETCAVTHPEWCKLDCTVLRTL